MERFSWARELLAVAIGSELDVCLEPDQTALGPPLAPFDHGPHKPQSERPEEDQADEEVAASTPGFLLNRIGLLVLGGSLWIVGVVLVAIAAVLHVTASSSVRVVKMSLRLRSDER